MKNFIECIKEKSKFISNLKDVSLIQPALQYYDQEYHHKEETLSNPQKIILESLYWFFRDIYAINQNETIVIYFILFIYFILYSFLIIASFHF